MSELHYHNGTLNFENCVLGDIASACGTPCYVYSKKTLEQNYLAYRTALDADNCSAQREHRVCYAVKANSNLGVLSTLANLGSGFDIVSVGELERVLLAGGKANQVVFSGVAKMQHEIERALEAGIHCFNVESETELERIATIAAANDCVAPISIRVNPDVDAQTHPYISTGLKENKFGIEIEQALGLYKKAEAHPALKVLGIDCHIGSQLTELQPFEDALQRVLALVDELDNIGIQLQHIDVGGGLGVRYHDENPPTPASYVAKLLALMENRPQSLVLEPGRSIAANAGVLLTRVDTIKSNGDKHFAIVDVAMNDMLRPALYDAWLDILPLKQNGSANTRCYDVVGPVCETGDFMGKQRLLDITTGDLLCINSAGAYGFVMASNYNTRARPAEVMVSDTEFRVVRERETIDDMVRGERCF